MRDSGRRRGNRKSRQREPRDPHSATARALGSGFDRRRRSGEAGDVAGCLLPACGVFFSNLSKRATFAMAKARRRRWRKKPAQWHRPLLASINHRSRKVEKPNSQGKRRPSTVDERTTDDDEHEAWHHARSWHPSNRSRPACRDRVSSRRTGGYGISIGQRGETCSGRIGLLGALFSNVTRGWCEDIATLPQQVCAGPEHAGPAKQSIVSSGTMPRMPCPDARCWRVPSKLVEAPVVVLFR